MHGRREAWIGVLAILSVALLSAASWAGGPSPDEPQDLYYFLNVDGPGPDFGEMDGRLKGIADAFGRGEFARCRELAEALIESSDDEGLRAEAVTYVVESYLAQGEFEKAAQIADEYDRAEIAARVASLKRGYSAALARLDVTVIGGGVEPVGLILKRGRLHRQAGCLELAQGSYWKVISEHRGSPEAVRAASEVVNMHQAYGTPESVTKVCETLVGLDPDSDVAVAVCRAISGSWAAWQGGETAAVMDILRGIAENHPNTRSGATSGLDLGQLLLASEQYEQAEEVWSRVVDEKVDEGVSQDARYRLADLRYEQGIKAFFAKDYESAVRWLGKLWPDIDLIGMRSPTLRFGDSPESRIRHGLLSLGEACEKLERWGEAAEAYGRLAIRGGPAEEVALFKLVRCYANLGDMDQARRACDRLGEQFPDSAYGPAARALLD